MISDRNLAMQRRLFLGYYYDGRVANGRGSRGHWLIETVDIAAVQRAGRGKPKGQKCAAGVHTKAQLEDKDRIICKQKGGDFVAEGRPGRCM